MARRYGRKKKSRPVKTTKTYKDGMKKQAVMFGALGILSVAIFYKTMLFQKIIEMTPTFEG